MAKVGVAFVCLALVVALPTISRDSSPSYPIESTIPTDDKSSLVSSTSIYNDKRNNDEGHLLKGTPTVPSIAPPIDISHRDMLGDVSDVRDDKASQFVSQSEKDASVRPKLGLRGISSILTALGIALFIFVFHSIEWAAMRSAPVAPHIWATMAYELARICINTNIRINNMLPGALQFNIFFTILAVGAALFVTGVTQLILSLVNTTRKMPSFVRPLLVSGLLLIAVSFAPGVAGVKIFGAAVGVLLVSFFHLISDLVDRRKATQALIKHEYLLEQQQDAPGETEEESKAELTGE